MNNTVVIVAAIIIAAWAFWLIFSGLEGESIIQKRAFEMEVGDLDFLNPRERELLEKAKETIATLIGMIDDGMAVVNGDDGTYLGTCVNPHAFEVFEARELLEQLSGPDSSNKNTGDDDGHQENRT